MSFGRSKSSTDSSTKVYTYNQQVGASEGSVGIGANARNNMLQGEGAIGFGTQSKNNVVQGAGSINAGTKSNVTINSLDAATVEQAFNAQKFMVDAGTEQFKTAVDYANNITDVQKDVLLAQMSSQLTNAKLQADAVANAQKSSNDIIQRTNEMFTAGIVRNAGISETALAETKTKEQTKLFISLALAGVIGVYLYNKTK